MLHPKNSTVCWFGNVPNWKLTLEENTQFRQTIGQIGCYANTVYFSILAEILSAPVAFIAVISCNEFVNRRWSGQILRRISKTAGASALSNSE